MLKWNRQPETDWTGSLSLKDYFKKAIEGGFQDRPAVQTLRQLCPKVWRECMDELIEEEQKAIEADTK